MSRCEVQMLETSLRWQSIILTFLETEEGTKLIH